MLMGGGGIMYSMTDRGLKLTLYILNVTAIFLL